jgi:lipid-binding SYLF domain-containing protein
MFKSIRHLFVAVGVAGLLGTTAAALASEQSDLVAAAQKAFADMQNDPDMTWFLPARRAYMAGLNFDGTVVTINGKWNQAYYGKAVTPVDILVRHSVTNPEADPLRDEVATAAK